MIFYTSVALGKDPALVSEQWAALGDDNLITWQKHPANPILTDKLHGDTKIYDWRDPFIFHDHNHTYLVLGGNLNHAKGGQAVVNLYQAQNEELTQWKYLGVLFHHPDPTAINVECPNFFKVGKRWVLVLSTYGKVQYFLGDFDSAEHQFKAQQQGTLDYSNNFYAPNCMEDAKGRRILWGWVKDFKGGLGWNGCLTLPRILSINAKGELEQEPAPELKKLRGQHFKTANLPLPYSKPLVPAVSGKELELNLELELGSANVAGLKVRRSDDGRRAISIRYDGHQLDVAGEKVPLTLANGETRLHLHIFLDRSVLEVYANHRACITRVIDGAEKDQGVELFAEGGQARIHSLDAWSMETIWLKAGK